MDARVLFTVSIFRNEKEEITTRINQNKKKLEVLEQVKKELYIFVPYVLKKVPDLKSSLTNDWSDRTWVEHLLADKLFDDVLEYVKSILTTTSILTITIPLATTLTLGIIASLSPAWFAADFAAGAKIGWDLGIEGLQQGASVIPGLAIPTSIAIIECVCQKAKCCCCAKRQAEELQQVVMQANKLIASIQENTQSDTLNTVTHSIQYDHSPRAQLKTLVDGTIENYYTKVRSLENAIEDDMEKLALIKQGHSVQEEKDSERYFSLNP